jgi:hypothetical protein
MKLNAHPALLAATKPFKLLFALLLVSLLPAIGRAQISQAATYFGRIGTSDFTVQLSGSGTSCTFDLYQNGDETGTGSVSNNRATALSTNRGRTVTLTFSGSTVTGALNGQPFSGQAEQDFGAVTSVSGAYFGTLIEIVSGGATNTYFVGVKVFPSGKVFMDFSGSSASTTDIYSIGTLATNGQLTLPLSSSDSRSNGDTLRMSFNPQGDLASGTMTSNFYPRNGYAFIATRLKGSTLVNVATRGSVTPSQAMTAGFVISGQDKTVLIRAVGPTLGAFGVTNANVDPQLTLFQGQTVLARNDNWGDNANAADIASAAGVSGAFGLVAGSKDAVLLVKLSPGAYTASATSTGTAAGDALIEVYEVSK